MNNRIKTSRKILIRYITSYYKAAARAENLKPNFYAGSAPSFWNKLCREKLEEEYFAIHRIVSFGSNYYVNKYVMGDLC